MAHIHQIFPYESLFKSRCSTGSPDIITHTLTVLRHALIICGLSFTTIIHAQIQELGVDDRRVSFMGPDGDPDYDGFSPKVAYNTANDQYLIVWSADDNTGPLINGETEVYGQLFDSNGPIGDRFRISQMGPNGDEEFDGNSAAVAYNTVRDEYMVVWHADDNTGGLLNNEFEIFGRRIDSDGDQDQRYGTSRR